MKTILKYWLIIVIIVTGLSGLIYAVVQQDLRQGANDPQIEIAEDTAAKLAAGQSTQSLVSGTTVDISKSLATYITVFDADGKIVASSAQLNGKIPTLPAGVFASVRQDGEDRITWQPQVGVRSAVVIIQFKGQTSGFVAVGRSLREVENREDSLSKLVLAAWITIIVASFLAVALLFGGMWDKLIKRRR